MIMLIGIPAETMLIAIIFVLAILVLVIIWQRRRRSRHAAQPPTPWPGEQTQAQLQQQIRHLDLPRRIGANEQIRTGLPQAATIDYRPGQLSRYRLLEQIGAGGMGTVFKAHDPELDRLVAVKFPRFDGPAEEVAKRRQRFQREARAAAQVWHPHVCPIYDVGEQDGQPFVVMGFVDGESLAQRLAAQGRFEDVGHAVALIRQVLVALDAVHARGILHRDIKPANILIDSAGHAVLTDFGLARSESPDESALTSEGMILGTPAYMAPEQAAARTDQIGAWTDVYGVGVVLYEMLTGRLPFEGPPLQVLAQLVHTEATPPGKWRPDLDSALQQIVIQALARDIAQRFPSARAFSEALAPWAADPATAVPTTHALGSTPSASKTPGVNARQPFPSRASVVVTSFAQIIFVLAVIVSSASFFLLIMAHNEDAIRPLTLLGGIALLVLVIDLIVLYLLQPVRHPGAYRPPGTDSRFPATNVGVNVPAPPGSVNMGDRKAHRPEPEDDDYAEAAVRKKKKKRASPWLKITALAGGGVAALVMVISAIVTLTRGAPPAQTVKAWDKFSTEENEFAFDYPRGWNARGYGLRGQREVEVKGPDGTITVKEYLTGSPVGDIKPVPDELSPVGQVHELRRPKDARSYQEGPAVTVMTKFGKARRSAYKDGAKRGYRATVLMHETALEVFCECRASDWDTLRPAFDHVIKSLGGGG
jgi:serine/threonine protein kinase